jgi:hypothetical protein
METNRHVFETGAAQRETDPRSVAQRELRKQSEALARDFRDLINARASAIRATRSAAGNAPVAHQLADALIKEIEQRGTPTLIKLALQAGGIDIRDDHDATEFRSALDQMREFLAELKENFKARLELLRGSVREHNERQAEIQLTAQENQARTFSQGMDSVQALRWLENEQNCRLRLTKRGIELAPASRINEMKIRAMVRLHAEGIKELLAARQEFGVIDLG